MTERSTTERMDPTKTRHPETKRKEKRQTDREGERGRDKEMGRKREGIEREKESNRMFKKQKDGERAGNKT